MTDGWPAAGGACRIWTDTEVSRNTPIRAASPKAGTTVPAGCNRTMAATVLALARSRSAAIAHASDSTGNGGFWPRLAA